MPMQSMPPPVFADSEPDGAGAAGAPPPPGGGAGAGSIDPAGWIDWMAAHPVQSMPPPPSAAMSALVSALMPASAAVSALVSRAIAGAKAAIAAESAAAGPSGSPLAPPEDTYVLADQPPKPGLCFKVTPKVYAVAFEDGSWSGFEIGTAWQTCPNGLEIDMADVVLSNGSGRPLVEAYLYGKSSICGWTLIDEYRHPPSTAAAQDGRSRQLHGKGMEWQGPQRCKWRRRDLHRNRPTEGQGQPCQPCDS